MAHEVTMGLTPSARKAIADLNAEFRKRIDNYRFARILVPLETSAQFSQGMTDEYNRRLAAIISHGTTETRPDRMVRVKCPQCGREELIAGDVERWKCPCGSVERFAYLTYLEA